MKVGVIGSGVMDSGITQVIASAYPKGLIAWDEEIGKKNIDDLIDKLYESYREERYRISPQLRG
jgi:3-hydroxyacyl-CoA dehydrogenase